MYVKNYDELIDHGNKLLREHLLNSIESALERVDPYRLTRELVRIEGGTLKIGDLEFNLSLLGRICVLGAGKATFPIAKALEEILDDRISEGLIIVKEDEDRKLNRIKVTRAGHPLPNKAGLAAAREIVTIASNGRNTDLFLVAFTGGSSALMPSPADGMSLEDKREITELLLGSGATIREVNAVRKHLSRTKGGRLAKAIAPATIVNITVSDVIGDPLDCITDPTVTDSSTFDDAKHALMKYDLWDKIPKSARDCLSKADPTKETLKEYGALRVHNFIIANNVMAAEAALGHLTRAGFHSQVLTTSLEGESREVGYALASIASEILEYDRPMKKPASIVCAGETLVRLEPPTKGAKGGPSQELAMAMAVRLQDRGNFAGIFFDTDGSDGPTDFAGAVIDSQTGQRAKALDLDLYESLKRHNVSTPLERLNDAVVTGPTGTNVMDLAIVIAD